MLAGSTEDKPMIAWIFDNQEYLGMYHEVYSQYMEYFNSGKFTEMYDNAIALISPYVEKDPSAFCTYEEFQKGSAALREFCLCRAESINGQLNGTIAITSEEQTATTPDSLTLRILILKVWVQIPWGSVVLGAGKFQFGTETAVPKSPTPL